MKKAGGIIAIIIGVIALLIAGIGLLFGGAAASAESVKDLNAQDAAVAKEVAKAGGTVILYSLISLVSALASIVLGAMAFSATKKIIGFLLIGFSILGVFGIPIANYMMVVSVIAGILVTLGTKPEAPVNTQQ